MYLLYEHCLNIAKSPRSIKTLLEISLDLARMAKSHDCNKSHDRPTWWIYVRRHCQLKYKHVNNINVAKMYFALSTSTLMKNHQTYYMQYSRIRRSTNDILSYHDFKGKFKH